MSEEIHFLRTKTLSMKTTRSSSADEVLKRVMRHNLREIQSEFGERADSKVDPRRIHLNETLFGLDTPDGVAGAARDAMLAAGAPQRKNAALGIEIVLSLPTGLTIDYRAYFTDAIQWANKYFDVPMLSAIIHNDEDYPHAHIVMLPMRDGELIGRNLLGDIPKQNAMHKSFHVAVGKRYGLSMPKPAPHYSAEVRHIAMQMARNYMRETSGFTDATVDALVKILAKDPCATMMALGLVMPTEPSKTVAGIFTRDCGKKTAIALSDATEPGRKSEQNQKRYALIALSNPQSSLPPLNEPSSASTGATMMSKGAMMELADDDQQPSASAPAADPAATDKPTTKRVGWPASTAASAAPACTAAPEVQVQPGTMPASTTQAPTTATTASKRSQAPDDETSSASIESNTVQQPTPMTGDSEGDYVRERDDDQRAEYWNSEAGEWGAPKSAKPSSKAKTGVSVRAALSDIGKSQRTPQRPQTCTVRRC